MIPFGSQSWQLANLTINHFQADFLCVNFVMWELLFSFLEQTYFVEIPSIFIDFVGGKLQFYESV